jgi:hypothetical protein
MPEYVITCQPFEQRIQNRAATAWMVCKDHNRRIRRRFRDAERLSMPQAVAHVSKDITSSTSL